MDHARRSPRAIVHVRSLAEARRAVHLAQRGSSRRQREVKGAAATQVGILAGTTNNCARRFTLVLAGRRQGLRREIERHRLLDDLRRQPTLQRPGQLGKAQRLGEMRLHPRRARRSDILRIGIGSERDDRQLIGANALLANGARCGITVAAGHLHIHQDEFERALAHHAFDHHRNRFVAIMRDCDLLPAAAQHLDREQAIDIMIFDEEDARRRENLERRFAGLALLALGSSRLACADQLSGQREREGRTHAGRAVDLERAAEQESQLAADTQPQAGPAEAPRGAAFLLRERQEDGLLACGADPDPGVLDPDPRFVSARLVDHADHAVLGELDRVADEIEHDLAQSKTVGQHMRPARRRLFEPGSPANTSANTRANTRETLPRSRQLDPQPLLARRGLMQRDAFIERCRKIDRRMIDRDLPRFRLGEIEDVVEQQHQRSARAHDHLGVAALFGIKLALQHQFGKSEDAVHRGTDFVAHIGEELGLRVGCILGLAPRPRQQQFELDPLRHFAGADDDALVEPAHRIDLDRAFGLDEHRRGVLAVKQATISEALLLALARDQALAREHDPRARLFAGALEHALAKIGRRRLAQHLRDRGGGIGAQAIAIITQHRIADVERKEIEALFARFEFPHHPVAPGEDRGERQAGQEIGRDEGLDKLQLDFARGARLDDRPVARPGHRDRDGCKQRDMNGRPRAAEAEGVEQRQGQDQEQQRIGALIEHEDTADDAGDEQPRFAGQCVQLDLAPAPDRIADEQHCGNDDDHAHRLGQEPGRGLVPDRRRVRPHCACGNRGRHHRAE